MHATDDGRIRNADERSRHLAVSKSVATAPDQLDSVPRYGLYPCCMTTLSSKPLTIGQVAAAAGVGVETVRFYERERLLAEPERTRAGYRQYPTDTVRRILFIQRAKELGFSLKEICELLSLRVDPGTSCADVKAKAEAKLASIDEKLKALQRMRRTLTTLAAACSGVGSMDACPILESLDDDQGSNKCLPLI